jgi:hypothetical protein
MKIATLSIILFGGLLLNACKASKEIKKAIAPPKENVTSKDSVNREDSIRAVNEIMTQFRKNRIDFSTFNAKIKVESSDSKGKNPDITAVVRIIKDSAIWMSLSATFLNIEVYRVLIKKDSVILLNKQEKEVQYRSMDYLQEVTQIPFDFKTVQDLLIGNPVFFNDSISALKEQDNQILISSVGEYFKSLLTITRDSKLMTRTKMDDVETWRNRTAEVTYEEYERNGDINFSTNRKIVASEKNKIEIRLNYKQYEFNKVLSVAFTVPKNYKRK